MEARGSRVDPELSGQLDNAGEHDRVEAVVMLRPAAGAGEPPPPDAVERAVEDLLRRVDEACGGAEYEFNVFGFLDSFAIAAERRFIDRLLEQPEIASATANRPSPNG